MKYLQKNRFIKTFEGFLGSLIKPDYSNLENISKPKDGIGGEVDQFTKNRILDVRNFDKWLSEKQNAPHMVGKINKLSPATIENYFFDQGVQCTDQEIFDFINKIKNDWFLTYSQQR